MHNPDQDGLAKTKVQVFSNEHASLLHPGHNINEEVNLNILNSNDNRQKVIFDINYTENVAISGSALQLRDQEKPRIYQAPDVDLIWKDVKIVSETWEKKEKKTKTILDGINGRVKGGECLAILGSTGAGKTTLLNYLSRKIESKNFKMSGEILLNNIKMTTEDFRAISSYVMQDDILEPFMTATEILLFTAKLKLNFSTEEIETQVYDMLKSLNLLRCKDTKIGDALSRGVSGGERKRVSIAVELITDPKIIFLDEPTTGLDSYNAYELLQLLNNFAKEKNKIVIYTIHQPSSEAYELLDKICILAVGKTVYFGPRDDCALYFQSVNIPIPMDYNPFEHFMEVTNVTSVESESIIKYYGKQIDAGQDKQEKYYNYISALNDKYVKDIKLYEDRHAALDGFSKDMEGLINSKKRKNNSIYDFCMLVGRNVIITARNPKLIGVNIGQYVIIAALLAAIFVKLSRDASGVQDRLGIVLLCSVMLIFSATTSKILTFAEERKVFLRERSNSLYTVFSYYMSKLVASVPICFVAGNIFGTIIYFALYLNDIYSWKYFTFLGILQLCAHGGTAMAFFLGSIVQHQETLVIMNTALTIPLMLLSGFFANADNFAPYLIPFKYISVFKYAYQILIHNEFFDTNPLNCFNTTPDACYPMGTRFLFLEPYYVSYIAFAAVIVFFHVVAFIMQYKFAKIRV